MKLSEFESGIKKAIELLETETAFYNGKGKYHGYLGVCESLAESFDFILLGESLIIKDFFMFNGETFNLGYFLGPLDKWHSKGRVNSLKNFSKFAIKNDLYLKYKRGVNFL